MKKLLLVLLSALIFAAPAFVKGAVEKFVQTSDKVKLYAKTSGKGPDCIYVHGGPGAWSKSFEYLGGKNLESFLRMTYFDQRGCGRSENASDRNYSLDRILDDIEDIRIASGRDKVYIMGYSFGGLLASNYAAKYPDKVKGLILVTPTLNAMASYKSQINYINTLINTNYATDEKANLKKNFHNAYRELNKNKLKHKILTENKETYELLSAIDSGNRSRYEFAFCLWNYPEYAQDFGSILSDKIQCPILAIKGDDDKAIGLNQEAMFKFTNAEYKTINGGHLLYYENNQEFVSSVQDFITSLEGEKAIDDNSESALA
jgi:proline iminopeptidase